MASQPLLQLLAQGTPSSGRPARVDVTSPFNTGFSEGLKPFEMYVDRQNLDESRERNRIAERQVRQLELDSILKRDLLEKEYAADSKNRVKNHETESDILREKYRSAVLQREIDDLSFKEAQRQYEEGIEAAKEEKDWNDRYNRAVGYNISPLGGNPNVTEAVRQDGMTLPSGDGRSHGLGPLFGLENAPEEVDEFGFGRFNDNDRVSYQHLETGRTLTREEYEPKREDLRSKVGSGLNVEAEASRLATPTDEDVFAERRSKLASYRDLLSEGDAHGYDKRRREDLDRRIREIEGKPEFRSEALDESLNQVVRTSKLHGASDVDVDVFRQFVQESPLEYRERALAEAERFFKKEDVADAPAELPPLPSPPQTPQELQASVPVDPFGGTAPSEIADDDAGAQEDKIAVIQREIESRRDQISENPRKEVKSLIEDEIASLERDRDRLISREITSATTIEDIDGIYKKRSHIIESDPSLRGIFDRVQDRLKDEQGDHLIFTGRDDEGRPIFDTNRNYSLTVPTKTKLQTAVNEMALAVPRVSEALATIEGNRDAFSIRGTIAEELAKAKELVRDGRVDYDTERIIAARSTVLNIEGQILKAVGGARAIGVLSNQDVGAIEGMMSNMRRKWPGVTKAIENYKRIDLMMRDGVQKRRLILAGIQPDQLSGDVIAASVRVKNITQNGALDIVKADQALRVSIGEEIQGYLSAGNKKRALEILEVFPMYAPPEKIASLREEVSEEE